MCLPHLVVIAGRNQCLTIIPDPDQAANPVGYEFSVDECGYVDKFRRLFEQCRFCFPSYRLVLFLVLPKVSHCLILS